MISPEDKEFILEYADKVQIPVSELGWLLEAWDTVSSMENSIPDCMTQSGREFLIKFFTDGFNAGAAPKHALERN